MELRENVNDLMSRVRVNEAMHRAIMEGNPQNEECKTEKRIFAAGGMRERRSDRRMKNRRKPVWRQAAVPAAAALLIMSTMYAGAGYLIDHTPLRDIFAARNNDALSVPEEQKRPDIYGEILDDSFSAAGTQADTEGITGESVTEETAARGKYGEIVMDNELFSIELLETTCAGRELTVSYILTKKTDQMLTVQVSIDNEYLGRWRDGLEGEGFDVNRILMRSGFGDSFRWNKLPQGCGYELAENQELHIITQLGKSDYLPGTYTLYAESYSYEAPVAENEGEAFQMVEVPDENVRTGFYRESIEIQRTGDYGLGLTGATDKTEDRVHFDQYDIYISPMTVYLTLYGTYEGEMSEIWGMESSHDVTIVFDDGAQTQTTVFLSGMGYGSGNLDVDMRASFDTVIDPDSIVKVMLDDVVIMGE